MKARGQILNIQQHNYRSLGSSASRRPSPIKLKQKRVTARNTAGNISSQGADSICLAPSEISTPQLVSGSCTPSPRKERKLSVNLGNLSLSTSTSPFSHLRGAVRVLTSPISLRKNLCLHKRQQTNKHVNHRLRRSKRRRMNLASNVVMHI